MSVYNYLLVNALSIIESKDTTKSKKLLQCKNFEPDSSLLWFRLLFDHQCEIQTVDHFRSWLQAFFIFRDFMSFRQADVPVYSSPDVLILLPNLDFASFSFRAPSLFYFVFLRLPAVSSDCLSCLFAYQMSLLICPAWGQKVVSVIEKIFNLVRRMQ